LTIFTKNAGVQVKSHRLMSRISNTKCSLK